MVVKRTSMRDSRLNNDDEKASNRKSRGAESRARANRELTDSERLDALRAQTFQTHLPDIPEIEGFHVCWLTTTNPKDPIFGRIRMGYILIRAEEIPGFNHSAIKTGDYAGCIGVNEMLAAKLPLHLYQMYMTELHFTQPMAEEEKLTEAIRAAQQEAALINDKALLTTEQGSALLGRAPAAPNFVTGDEG